MQRPSYALGEPSADLASAWGSDCYGRTVVCDEHGEQFVTFREQERTSTRYDDGKYDASFRERLACGCLIEVSVWRGKVERYQE